MKASEIHKQRCLNPLFEAPQQAASFAQAAVYENELLLQRHGLDELSKLCACFSERCHSCPTFYGFAAQKEELRFPVASSICWIKKKCSRGTKQSGGHSPALETLEEKNINKKLALFNSSGSASGKDASPLCGRHLQTSMVVRGTTSRCKGHEPRHPNLPAKPSL